MDEPTVKQGDDALSTVEGTGLQSCKANGEDTGGE